MPDTTTSSTRSSRISLKTIGVLAGATIFAVWLAIKLRSRSQPTADVSLEDAFDEGEDNPEIVFEPEKLDFIIEMNDFTFDNEDYVVEDTPEQPRVMATDGEPIKRHDIGYLDHDNDVGINFVRNDFSEIVSCLSDRDIR